MVFLRALRFSSLIQIDSQLIPPTCGAVLRGQSWILKLLPKATLHAFGPTVLTIQSEAAGGQAIVTDITGFHTPGLYI